MQNQFHGQQRDDAEGHRAAGGQHAEEIPHAGPDHSDVRLHGVRVDDGGDGVGGIVEAVHEFESQGGEESDAEERVGQPACGVDTRQVSEQVGPDIDEAAQQDHNGHYDADSSGTCRHLRIKNRSSCCHSSPLGVWEIQVGKLPGDCYWGVTVQ